jgi:hypothetical protein
MKIAPRVAALVFAAATMACGVPSTSAGDLHGFTSDKKQDLFGYYMPTKDVRFGKFKLNNVSIAGLDDFKKFEKGGYKGVPFASVLLNFDDTSSPKKQGELGEYYANAPRVLPSAYRVVGNTLTFIGSDKQLGVVTFSGTLDLTAIKSAQNGGSLEKPVLKGDLAVGTKTVKGVTFTWFGGD